MELAVISVEGDCGVDDVLSLHRALMTDSDLGGHVSHRECIQEQESGSLGVGIHAISVALGPGGGVTALASALASVSVAWIRHRSSNLSLRITTRSGSELRLDAKKVRKDSIPEIRRLVEDVAREIEKPGSETG